MAPTTAAFAPVLYTQRLTLTLIDLEKDLEFRTYSANDFYSHHDDNFIPWTNNDTLAYLEGVSSRTLKANPQGPGYAVFIIHLGSEAGEKIGWIMRFQRDRDVPVEVGFMILGKYQNSGYGTEAVKEAMRYWREDVGMKEMFASTAVDNVASQRLLINAGFVPGGTTVVIGWTPEPVKCLAFVLPGMDSMSDVVLRLVTRSMETKTAV